MSYIFPKKSFLIFQETELSYILVSYIYTNRWYLPTKVTPDINFTDEPVQQYGVPVVENTFVDDCEQITKM